MEKRPADPDSRARTHLANERTFLAWLRTGLSLVALGLASAQFLERDIVPGIPVTTIFAMFLIVVGVTMTLLGGVHYLHARDEIEEGQFLPSTRAVILAMSAALVSGLLALVLVVLLRTRG